MKQIRVVQMPLFGSITIPDEENIVAVLQERTSNMVLLVCESEYPTAYTAP